MINYGCLYISKKMYIYLYNIYFDVYTFIAWKKLLDWAM